MSENNFSLSPKPNGEGFWDSFLNPSLWECLECTINHISRDLGNALLIINASFFYTLCTFNTQCWQVYQAVTPPLLFGCLVGVASIDGESSIDRETSMDRETSIDGENSMDGVSSMNGETSMKESIIDGENSIDGESSMNGETSMDGDNCLAQIPKISGKRM